MHLQLIRLFVCLFFRCIVHMWYAAIVLWIITILTFSLCTPCIMKSRGELAAAQKFDFLWPDWCSEGLCKMYEWKSLCVCVGMNNYSPSISELCCFHNTLHNMTAALCLSLRDEFLETIEQTHLYSSQHEGRHNANWLERQIYPLYPITSETSLKHSIVLSQY